MRPTSMQENGWCKGISAFGVAALTATALQVGTGGEQTAEYYKARGHRGYSFVHYESFSPDSEAVSVRSESEKLSHIRAIFKPSMTELASLFGVTRQAIYLWQAGSPPSSEHYAKIDDLAKAADILAIEGFDGSNRALYRKLAGGRSIFEIVQSGGSAEESARKFVQMVRREADQRKRLEERLAGRKKPQINFAEVGAPRFDEQA